MIALNVTPRLAYLNRYIIKKRRYDFVGTDGLLLYELT